MLHLPWQSLCLLFGLLSIARPAAADDLATAREQLYTAQAAKLQSLASWCDSNGLTKQAELTRKWLPERDKDMIYVFTLPPDEMPPAKLADSPAGEEWWDRFTLLRRKQAEKLIELADAAIKSQQPALAIELVHEAVRENPDHERGRRILGYEKRGSRWVSPEAAKRLDAGQAYSEKFGWLAAADLPRYERGQRLYRGHWIEPSEDARFHGNIRNGWRVESDHFTVITNHSLEEGARLAGRLEMLRDVWRQAFVLFYATPDEIQRAFASDAAPQPASTRELHQVVYFRTKQQYVDALKPIEPQIGKSLGYYSHSNKSAYFFPGDKQYDGTLFHEATHQLFFEERPGVVEPGKSNNFWVVEAIACYMESLAEHRLLDDESFGSYVTIGGKNAGRAPAARARLLDDRFYAPLRQLVAEGREQLQHEPRLPTLYSQGAGMALFLMNGNGGRYRAPLLEYLIAAYTGQSNADTLEKVTGQTYEELDRQYREFME